MIVKVLFYFCFQSPCKPKWRNGDEDLLRTCRGCFLLCGKRNLVFRFHFSVCYTHDCTPNVVAIAVRIVITILRTLPQVELLLNVPIVVKFEIELNLFIKALFLLQSYCTNFAPCKIERDRAK